jgi:PAS domain S-box-containing protein
MPTDPPAAPTWSEEKFRALTLHSGDIISLIDAQGRLLYNSPASERISGFSAEELAGVDTFQFIHPDDQAAVGQAFQQLLAAPGSAVTVQYRYRTKAGGWTWMEAVASNQLDNPDVRGVVVNSRDITERKRADEERGRLETQLIHRQRLESLGTLAGGIAHDFNNLLSALGAHVALAEDVSTEPEVRAELEGARAALKRASDLTRQLLGLARRQPTSPVTLDLGAALQRVRPLLERLLGGQIRIGLSAPADPAWIRIDPSQLEQVLVNLSTNARDAMPEGGHLQLELTTTMPRPGETAAGSALLRVMDDGGGIPPEVLGRAFEPFFTTKPLGRGTGLGLAVSHGIVTQAGGTIRLESAPDAGTTALLSFPLVTAPTPGAGAVAPPAAGTSVARPGERLLLADDDDLVRTATRRLLARLGWLVDEACDGQEAVERVSAAPRAYAAVVLDVRMPRLGGPAAAQHLARVAPGLPVIFISGYAEEADRLEEVLQKPFEAAELGARLRTLIDRRASPPGRSTHHPTRD